MLPEALSCLSLAPLPRSARQLQRDQLPLPRGSAAAPRLLKSDSSDFYNLHIPAQSQILNPQS